jgi:putative salt-induced outer membrane protein
MRIRVTLAITSSTLLFALPALAQIPKGTTKGDTVSKGKTDVTTDTFAAAEAPPGDSDEEGKDTTELQLSAGSLITTGNSKLLAATAASTFRFRRGDNQFTAIGAGNYGRAGTTGPTETTVENLQGRARYDRFFAGPWVGFLGVQGRRDRFAGLDLRLQVDPGVAYYFINEKDRIFWLELGYDLLHDVRRDGSRVPTAANGQPIAGAPLADKTSTVHSGRAFVGYRYKINDGVSLSAGLEFLQGISDTAIRRMNGEAVVTSKLTETFALATSFLFRYDNAPLPGKEQLDTITSVSLVYTLL